MRTFEVKITVQIPISDLPLDKIVDDDFATTVYNTAMRKVERRGLMAVNIVEKRVDEPDRGIF